MRTSRRDFLKVAGGIVAAAGHRAGMADFSIGGGVGFEFASSGTSEVNVQLEGLFSDALLECLPFQQLHGDKMPPIHLCDLINSADVGMIQSRGSTRFTTKALQRLRISG